MDTKILNTLNSIAISLQSIATAVSPGATQELGFSEPPKPQVYLFCNRKHGGVWYTLNGQNEPEVISLGALTGYVRKIEFKQVERRNAETSKMHCYIEADRTYVLESGSKAHFTKGLLSAISSMTPDELKMPITIVPQASTENAEVLFCNVYQGGKQIFATYGEETDWRSVASDAKRFVELANGGSDRE